MIWGFPNMLRRLWPSRRPTRGETLRRAMRTAEGGRPVSTDDFEELFAAEAPAYRGPAAVSRDILRDGTPYEESGAHENDWRL